MNVLIINGSPKGERSNTYQLTKAFLEGMRESGEIIETREMAVSRLDIRPCLGCFSCWNKTPGKCCIADDMSQVIEAMLWADLTVWSFPLYYFSVPGPLKNLIDRQLPMVLPFMSEDGGASGSHPARYDVSRKKTVLISTCGFYTVEGNYDSVYSLFDHICGKNQYTALFCGQGELFRVPDLKRRTEEYLGYVRQAGREYMTGGISSGTRANLDQLLFPRKVFEGMADASWGVDRETGEKESDTLIFTRQMATLYQKENWPGHDLVLEMVYTDVNERYQMILGKEGSTVLTDGFHTPTTTVETPVSVWRAIAAGEISGSEALMRHQYRVEGDFDLLIKWDNYFAGAGDADAPEEEDFHPSDGGIHMPSKPTSLTILLLPWIVFWAGASIHSLWGSLASLATCVLTPLWFYQNRKTVYDVLSGGLVTCFSVALLLDAPVRVVIPLAYFAFGIMWTVTCFCRIPLTAHYSMNDYDGETALSNPLFIRTNRILTLAWGVLYLLTPIWTYFILGTGIGGWIGAINSILPLLMGIFTSWFQKWYPARIAMRSGEKEDKGDWKTAWAGMGLMLANCLSGILLFNLEKSGAWKSVCIAAISILCVADVVAVYIIIRRLSGKK